MANYLNTVRNATRMLFCCLVVGLTVLTTGRVTAQDAKHEAETKAADPHKAVDAGKKELVEKPLAEKGDDVKHDKAHDKAGHGDAAHDAAAHDESHGADGHADAAHGAKNPYDPLDWKKDLALWSFVTFLIFAAILRLFAWGPLASALDAREAKVHGNIAHAEEARMKAERLLADYEAKLAAAQDEVIKTLAEARRDAEHTRQEILAQTEKDVNAMKDRALLEIERTRDSALNELFSHMAGTVASATEKVLGRTLTDSDQDRLVNEALVEFSRQQAS